MYNSGYYEFFCGVKTVAGHEALERIPALLEGLGASKPMIVTDKGVAAAGLVSIVEEALASGMPAVAVEDDVPVDSDVGTVHRIASVYRDAGCDALIAVGGGSVMDTAKGVNIMVSEEAESLLDFSGAGVLKRPLKPLVAVPTTAGTGSEVTLVAVINDPSVNRKLLFSSHFLLPDIAVLDPRMTLTLPPHLTAATAMDAMTHAVEAYTCLSKNPISDAFAVEAISLISRNLMAVVKRPEDQEGRLALATAANLAGIAFSNSMVGMVHTLGHSVGGVCHVAHGTCMSILLPYGLEYNMHRNGHWTGELLYPIAGEAVYAATAPDKRAEKTVACIREFNQALYEATDGRHSRFFKEVTDQNGNPAVTREHLPAIARTALGDGSIFYNPEEVDYDDALMVMEASWAGDPLDRSRVKTA
ncbi:iron-containing alcohol dehydrogenase [Desulfoluna butyratoxydans]|uniref:Alcohol dehydrogenase iron-type n=1 Tax=Desulfoluna butyratoxydans TaxID=231438 RepID=A0A4U8YUU1_9BACT|nr:iron-containing alcohol dehydrogenase [Desulfoluna butyratoxydans]VFQ47347.1 alcohol dehydrogenase iron-type [Desulfoluna butyratoxydans]